MQNVQEQLTELDKLIKKAAHTVASDQGASPVLAAVVNDFREKSKKALNSVPNANREKVLRIVVELEQAADSAKVAANADKGATEETRHIIQDAHDPICGLKAALLENQPP